MKFISRLILISSLLCFGQLQMLDILHDRGMALCMLKNLPHRGLGMLYTAWIAQPHRTDWQTDYLAEWAIVMAENRMLEGTTKPVMPFLAIEAAKQNPNDKQLQAIAKLAVQMERKAIENR